MGRPDCISEDEMAQSGKSVPTTREIEGSTAAIAELAIFLFRPS